MRGFYVEVPQQEPWYFDTQARRLEAPLVSRRRGPFWRGQGQNGWSLLIKIRDFLLALHSRYR